MMFEFGFFVEFFTLSLSIEPLNYTDRHWFWYFKIY